MMIVRRCYELLPGDYNTWGPLPPECVGSLHLWQYIYVVKYISVATLASLYAVMSCVNIVGDN